jgi:uncharacterized phage protein (TIGR01671 family)
MREIKFRAWQFHPSLHRPVGMYPVTSLVFYDDNGGGEAFLLSGGDGIESSEYFEDIELMQYTGLKDKNGKEIYEGDILKYFSINDTFGPDRYLVEWQAPSFGLKRLLYERHDYPTFIAHDFVIIGNIYQNPELLK